MSGSEMELLLAEPRGFCAGVDRAIEIVERALQRYGAPIYVRHEIVHNEYVVNDLRQRGAVFVDELSDVPENSTVIFSAHGVSQSVRDEAQARGLSILDATCPLVTKVHVEVRKLHEQGLHTVMIGHRGHPEVEGTMGQVGAEAMSLVETVDDVANLPLPPDQPIAYVTQTTLSVDDAQDVIAALKSRFQSVSEPKRGDICYATQNRQDAVKVLADQVDLVLVIGSPSSSNSNRLQEVARKRGVPAYLINSAEQVQAAWLSGVTRVGISAGASAPEVLVQELVTRLKAMGAVSVRSLPGVKEDVSFPLPKGLSAASAPNGR